MAVVFSMEIVSTQHHHYLKWKFRKKYQPQSNFERNHLIDHMKGTKKNYPPLRSLCSQKRFTRALDVCNKLNGKETTTTTTKGMHPNIFCADSLNVICVCVCRCKMRFFIDWWWFAYCAQMAIFFIHCNFNHNNMVCVCNSEITHFVRVCTVLLIANDSSQLKFVIGLFFFCVCRACQLKKRFYKTNGWRNEMKELNWLFGRMEKRR